MDDDEDDYDEYDDYDYNVEHLIDRHKKRASREIR